MKWSFDPLLFVLFSLGPWLTALFTARFYSDQLLNWYSIYFPFHLPYFRFENSECYLNNIQKTYPQAVVRWHSGYFITSPALEITNKYTIYRWKKIYHSSVQLLEQPICKGPGRNEFPVSQRSTRLLLSGKHFISSAAFFIVPQSH